MTERIKVREVIEYEIDIEEYEKDLPINQFLDWGNAIGDCVTIHKEIVGREHVVDYTFDVDRERELWLIREDGKVVFEHRSHDMRNQHWMELTGKEAPMGDKYWWYGDLLDEDKSWKVLNP